MCWGCWQHWGKTRSCRAGWLWWAASTEKQSEPEAAADIVGVRLMGRNAVWLLQAIEYWAQKKGRGCWEGAGLGERGDCQCVPRRVCGRLKLTYFLCWCKLLALWRLLWSSSQLAIEGLPCFLCLLSHYVLRGKQGWAACGSVGHSPAVVCNVLSSLCRLHSSEMMHIIPTFLVSTCPLDLTV